MILVSIICPTYNWKKEWLSEAIDSVISQSYEDWELIIINDASTNDIESTILEYAKKDKRIIYIKNEENLKLTNTLNKGLELAKWKYIARIDDDDIWVDPDKLQKQVDFMEQNPDYGLCGTSVITIDQEGNEIAKQKSRTTDLEIRKAILQSNQLAHSSIIIRKEVLDQVGVYDPGFNMAEDYELWCRIGRVSKFYNLPDYCLKYRINLNSVSNKNRRRQLRLAFKAFWINRKYYPNFWKALIFRSIDYILPQKLTQKILSWIK